MNWSWSPRMMRIFDRRNLKTMNAHDAINSSNHRWKCNWALPAYTMCRCHDIIGRYERCTAMEMTVVHQTGYPWILLIRNNIRDYACVWIQWFDVFALIWGELAKNVYIAWIWLTFMPVGRPPTIRISWFGVPQSVGMGQRMSVYYYHFINRWSLMSYQMCRTHDINWTKSPLTANVTQISKSTVRWTKMNENLTNNKRNQNI